MAKKRPGPRILFLDIETAPIVAYVWGLWQQNVGLNQIKSDWHMLSWAAKWRGEKKVHYADQRRAKRIEDDKPILEKFWKLLDQADVIVTQNGKAFDEKKIKARFILNGMKPPSSFLHIDTKLLAKKHFALTSNRLEYMTDKLNKKYKKLKHGKFPGFELWRECLARNPKAWREMEKYNKHDVLALEELYEIFEPWGVGVNFNVFSNHEHMVCNCGCPTFKRDGYAYTNNGKYQRYRCTQCGLGMRGKQNLFGKGKRDSLGAVK